MDVRGLVGARPTGQSRVLSILSGYVSLNRPAPATFADPIWVIVPSHSSDTPYGPLSWQASHGTTLPVAGTPVTLGIDDQGAPVVVHWEGPYVAPSGGGGLSSIDGGNASSTYLTGVDGGGA